MIAWADIGGRGGDIKTAELCEDACRLINDGAGDFLDDTSSSPLLLTPRALNFFSFN